MPDSQQSFELIKLVDMNGNVSERALCARDHADEPAERIAAAGHDQRSERAHNVDDHRACPLCDLERPFNGDVFGERLQLVERRQAAALDPSGFEFWCNRRTCSHADDSRGGNVESGATPDLPLI